MSLRRRRGRSIRRFTDLKNRANNYGYNPDEQDTLTYTGMGLDINVHDQWAVESMGSIQDRRQEHLGKSDVAIIRYRKILRRAIAEAGDEASASVPFVFDDAAAEKVLGPRSIDVIAANDQWRNTWQQRDDDRRAACSWPAGF